LTRNAYLLRDLTLLLLVLSLVFLIPFAMLRRGAAREAGSAETNGRGAAANGEGTPEADAGRVLPLGRAVEERLRTAVEQTIFAQMRVLRDTPVNAGMERILARLKPGMEGLPYDVGILVVESNTVNALAFPGGLIVVFTGLVESLQTPEQMAAVLAHELGHVVHRDALHQLVRKMGLTTLLSLAGGPESAVLVKRIVEEALHISFSRSVEARADRFALDLLDSSGIDPASLARALGNLKREPPDDGVQRLLVYLDTHPPIAERIRAAEDFAAGRTPQTEPLAVDWTGLRAWLAER